MFDWESGCNGKSAVYYFGRAEEGVEDEGRRLGIVAAVII